MIVYWISSFIIVFAYFKFIPYYNKACSTYWCIWVMNVWWTVLFYLLSHAFYFVDGHIIMIILGYIIWSYLAINLRNIRIKSFIYMTIDKMKTYSDAIN